MVVRGVILSDDSKENYRFNKKCTFENHTLGQYGYLQETLFQGLSQQTQNI